MKKLLAWILIGMMLVTFTACTSSAEETAIGEPQDNGSTEEVVGETEADVNAGASIVVDESGLMVITEIEVLEETETTQSYDVVVVGAGGAGLTAAIAAAENGAEVVVLEQENIVGGNTSWSGAGMDIPDNWVQAKQGIEDSIELYTEDTVAGGDRTNLMELTNVLAENALPMAEWLRDDVGVKFMDDFQKHFGGHTVARAIVVEGGIGSQLVMAEFLKAQELGVGTTHMEWIQTYPFCFPTTGKISFVADTRMYGDR